MLRSKYKVRPFAKRDLLKVVPGPN